MPSTVVLMLIVGAIALVALLWLDALALRRRGGRGVGKRAEGDRPATERRPPGDGFHANNQSWT